MHSNESFFGGLFINPNSTVTGINDLIALMSTISLHMIILCFFIAIITKFIIWITISKRKEN